MRTQPRWRSSAGSATAQPAMSPAHMETAVGKEIASPVSRPMAPLPPVIAAPASPSTASAEAAASERERERMWES